MADGNPMGAWEDRDWRPGDAPVRAAVVAAAPALGSCDGQEDGRMWRKESKTMRTVAVAALVALVLAGPASGQVGTQLIVTMNLAGPVKLTGGSYYIAFTIDDSILTGPQSDSSNWTHYVLYRQGRFFFGRVPPAPFRPFGFEAIRPPTPYPYGDVSPDRRSPRVPGGPPHLPTRPTLSLKIN